MLLAISNKNELTPFWPKNMPKCSINMKLSEKIYKYDLKAYDESMQNKYCNKYMFLGGKLNGRISNGRSVFCPKEIRPKTVFRIWPNNLIGRISTDRIAIG